MFKAWLSPRLDPHERARLVKTGRKMKFSGTTVLRLKDGKIVEEVGLDDGVTALAQLGLIRPV